MPEENNPIKAAMIAKSASKIPAVHTKCTKGSGCGANMLIGPASGGAGLLSGGMCIVYEITNENTNVYEWDSDRNFLPISKSEDSAPCGDIN